VDITIIVNDSPGQSRAAQTALRFCRAALRRRHCIQQVFFYGEGVYQQLASGSHDAGDPDLNQDWQQFASQNGVPIIVCPAATERRLPANWEARGNFEISGLAEFMELAAAADRVVSFGGP